MSRASPARIRRVKPSTNCNRTWPRSSGCSLRTANPNSSPSSSVLRKCRWPDMPKLPVLKPQEVVSRLEALGFVEVRQRGAHKQFRHADGRGTTVPFHKGRDISPVLLRKIARDIGMPAEDLVAAKG